MSATPDQLWQVNDINSDVSLWRDPWGIPHIQAQNDWDAFVGLGFAHAQDRLWQMDLQRRKATGRWAEWRGKEAVNADVLARRLGGKKAAVRDYASLNEEARKMLQAYSAGVNAFIALDELPPEYALLDAKPEAWEPWHSIAVFRQIGLLLGSFWLKLFRATVFDAISEENLVKLRYDDSGEDLFCMPTGDKGKRWADSLSELHSAMSLLLKTQAPDQMAGGSNNWAVSPALSSTGRPILMGDPHRELEVPTMYTQAHIAGKNFDVIGLTVPGVPGFPHAAHNEHVAWCVTHAFMDIHDLYVEQFSNDGKLALYEETWHPVTQTREIIKVRDGDDIEITVIETRNGPVIAGDPQKGTALTLKSMQFAYADQTFDCLSPMLKACSVESLYTAVKDWGVIDHNLVAADTAGNIGHRVRAKVPIRSSKNGWLPVPGWLAEYQWNGIIPPQSMPQSVNPSSGFIVTANNRVREDNKEQYLCTDCHPPFRARRISTLLVEEKTRSVATLDKIYTDLRSGPGIEFTAFLDKHAAPHVRSLPIVEKILAWDGQMDHDSSGALAYSSLRLAFTQVLAERSGMLTSKNPGLSSFVNETTIISQFWWMALAFLRSDDRSLNAGLSWTEVFSLAIEKAVYSYKEEEWGSYHLPEQIHPLSSQYPEYASELDVKCAIVGGDNDTVFATGYSAGEGFSTKYSALARTSFDVGAWNNCEWIVFQGASGVPENPHRGDQNPLWAAGKTIPMLYDWNEIANKSTLFVLNPGK